MNCDILDIQGVKYVVIEEGASMHQIHIDALASWGTLLGIDDPGEVLEVILSFEDKPAAPGQPNTWTDSYEALGEGLMEMSKAGVPPEVMGVLLDPALGSPVPGEEKLGRIQSARQQAMVEVGQRSMAGPRTRAAEAAMSTFKGRVVAELSVEIEDSKTAFLDALAPTFYVEAEPPPVTPTDVPGESLAGELVVGP